MTKTQKQKPPKVVTCPDCHGSGGDEMDDSMYCPLCQGEGQILVEDIPEVFK